MSTDRTTLSFHVNGDSQVVVIATHRTLLDVLRDDLAPAMCYSTT
jgi:aerobic-type carbon monoxide dehydrogenase small subunit (CoxS/CutS family)